MSRRPTKDQTTSQIGDMAINAMSHDCLWLLPRDIDWADTEVYDDTRHWALFTTMNCSRSYHQGGVPVVSTIGVDRHDTLLNRSVQNPCNALMNVVDSRPVGPLWPIPTAMLEARGGPYVVVRSMNWNDRPYANSYAIALTPEGYGFVQRSDREPGTAVQLVQCYMMLGALPPRALVEQIPQEVDDAITKNVRVRLYAVIRTVSIAVELAGYAIRGAQSASPWSDRTIRVRGKFGRSRAALRNNPNKRAIRQAGVA